ncbi:hypothetical protein Poli38472_010939 [Pythium oligandrum]|uniref:Crinkler effector protein N-terminal domain-containing protein n=1 Tax=Pythium oligandrum TaxID=41045 RepID=A0A8K1FGP3_PYTOL|nr:hypothetical protein Poli38472_010939 [Pythium oligandrum]|eukprot:TMW61876.1 hypothetical protein Poli38472_010939 [Pythium oligandrum]
MMTTRLYIVCVNVRDGMDFGVRMAPDEYIGELKERINERQKYTQNADDLKLYLAKAKESDQWLAADDPAVTNLRHNVVSDEIQELLREDLKLQAGKRIDNLFQSAPNADVIHVLVVVPPPPASSPPATSLSAPVISFTITRGRATRDENDKDPWEAYTSIGKRLKDDKIVKDLAAQVERVAGMKKSTPFIVLENSSGTGKTQMAFNLEATELFEVFFIMCASSADRDQPIYEAFNQRSRSFEFCVDKDLPFVIKGSVQDLQGINHRLYLYGFIIAALNGDATFSERASRTDVELAIQRRQDRMAKPMVFFLDEFPRVGSGETNSIMDLRKARYRMMRNVFRSFSFPVVISSTNGTARNLFSIQGASRSVDPYLWCIVFPSLPHVSLDGDIKSVKCPDQVKRILQHSRPLFVKLCLEYIKVKPCTGPLGVAYLDEMVASLAKRAKKLKRRSDEFNLGQFGLFLCTSFKLANGQYNVIDSHFAQLHDEEPIDLTLSPLEDQGLFVDDTLWESCCVFPSPSDDVLLHLAMTGGPQFPPLEKAMHNMMKLPSIRQQMYWSNVDQKTNDGMALEALVSAAVVLASHSGGLGGVAFPDFLGRLLYELGVTREATPMDFPVTLINSMHGTGIREVVVPFLSAPNVEWPQWLLEDWKYIGARLDNFRRTVNDDRIDFKIDSDLISGECKDYSDPVNLKVLKHILERVPERSKIHFVVTRKLQDSYFTQADASEFLTHHGLENARIYRILGPQRLEVLNKWRQRGKKRPMQALDPSGVEQAVSRLIVFIEVGDDVWDHAFFTPL